MDLRRPRIATLALLLVAITACTETPTDPASLSNPARLIYDGANGGNPHVFFLPPMLPDPSALFSADFDPEVDVSITICVWEITAGACGASIAKYSRTTGSGSEPIRIPDREEFYFVNWSTRRVPERFPLHAGEVYRIRVLAGSVELAFADVEFVRPGRMRPHAGNAGAVRVVAGQTLPIKMRIEEGWDNSSAVNGPQAGGGHTCRLTRAGAAWCWGSGSVGQLGDGNFYTNDPYGSVAPVAVTGHLRFVTLSAGMYHNCALTAAGAAWCWGLGTSGQLGDGTLYSSPQSGSATPVAVTGGHAFVALTAREAHTCGLTPSGAAFCWGLGVFGQLGDGTFYPGPQFGSATPVAVTGGHAFSALTAGRNHTCGFTANGAGWCWGHNGYGQLGTSVGFGFGGVEGSAIPVAVIGGQAFTSLAGADYHTCGVTTSGAGYCWGSGNYGQGGTGSYGSGNGDSTPALVTGGLTFSTTDVGDLFSCGITTAGAAWCWGLGNGGQLGSGTTPFTVPAPVAVVGGHTFTSFSVGGGHSCALATDDTAYCWGGNGIGELGDGNSNTFSATPVLVTVAPPGGW